MKRILFTNAVSIFIVLLFVYTSTSKLLEYHKFVFQMRLAPVPMMKVIAPTLGWVLPIAEMGIAISIAVGFFYGCIKTKGLFASVILLSVFEIYISIMLLSDSPLPCTCGGIVSHMGWRQHLFFNAFVIAGGILSIYFLKKQGIKDY